MASLTPEERAELGRKGAQVRWEAARQRDPLDDALGMDSSPTACIAC